MNEPEIRAVVFDMDGVLFDSERITRIMWGKAAAEYGISDFETAVRDCTGSSRTDQYEYLWKKYGRDFPAVEFRERCSVLFHTYADENGLPLMHYAREILDYLAEKKYPLALASSTRKDAVYRELKEADFFKYFSAIICGDEVEHSKPDPEIYLRACSALGVPPEKCVAVEDSPNGIKSVYAAGMMPVMVPDQIQPGDEIKKLLFRLCPTLEDLKSFL